MTRAQMHPRYRNMARRALGLPNVRKRSYRNSYVAAYTPGIYDLWIHMLEQGWADAMPLRSSDKMRRFWLTPEGARLALEPGEILCLEDFPEAQP